MKEVKLRRYKNVIYELYCIETDMYYIGQTIKPLNDRISKHFSDAKRGREQLLYEDIIKYGRQSFTYKQIEEVVNAEDLDDREKFWIHEYICNGFKLYNNELGGKKGIDVPHETRVRMSKAKGTQPFLVYTVDGIFVEKFDMITDANVKLNTNFTNKSIINGNVSKGYIGIYEHEFSEKKLNILLGSIYKNGNVIRKNHDVSGKNNPMYNKGIHVFAYNENGLIKEYFTMSKCIEETKVNKYSIQKYMDTGHMYKGYLFYSYKDEESYN